MTIKQISSTQKQLNDLARNPLHACGGTFTHSTTQAVTTAGTVLTFDTEIRNSGITVDATKKIFTVNTGGMFLINLSWTFSVATNHFLYLLVNGVVMSQFTTYGTNQTYHTGMTMKYLQKNHTLSFNLVSGANTNVSVNPEDSNGESPILQICQVSPRFTAT